MYENQLTASCMFTSSQLTKYAQTTFTDFCEHCMHLSMWHTTFQTDMFMLRVSDCERLGRLENMLFWAWIWRKMLECYGNYDSFGLNIFYFKNEKGLGIAKMLLEPSPKYTHINIHTTYHYIHIVRLKTEFTFTHPTLYH